MNDLALFVKGKDDALCGMPSLKYNTNLDKTCLICESYPRIDHLLTISEGSDDTKTGAPFPKTERWGFLIIGEMENLDVSSACYGTEKRMAMAGEEKYGAMNFSGSWPIGEKDSPFRLFRIFLGRSES